MAEGSSPPAVTALPATEGAAPPLARPAWRGRGRAAVGLALAAAALAGGGLALTIAGAEAVGLAGLVLAEVLALVGAGLGLAAAAGMLRSAGAIPPGFAALVGGVGVLANALMALLGALVAVMATLDFARGRQLRARGRVLLPRVEAGGAAWSGLGQAPALPEALRGELAERWRENGRTEHASVAAFARLTLDLMALGAPPELVQAAHRDALDEIRHAELCFSLARALDGREAGPGPFPEAQRARTLPGPRTLALARLAVDSLVDGALHEGVSARVIARLARRCEDPATRAVLKELAADEGRHAAHGWAVADWCLAQGGPPVAAALLGAAEALPLGPPPNGRGPELERWGIHGAALEATCYAAARARLVARVRRAAGARRAA